MDSTARSMSRSGQYRCLTEGICTPVICAMVASRKQGNDANETRSSSSPKWRENPSGETLATPIPEVSVPAVVTFIDVGIHESLSVPNSPITQAIVLPVRHLDVGVSRGA
jgi:hypothetical protein